MVGLAVLASSCTSWRTEQPAPVTTAYQTSGAPITETLPAPPTAEVGDSDLVTLQPYPSGDPRISETYSCPLFGFIAVTDDGAIYGLGGCGSDVAGSSEYVVELPVGQRLRIEMAQPKPFTLTVQTPGPVTVDGATVLAVWPGSTVVVISGLLCGTGTMGTSEPPASCPLMRVHVTG